ncbi:MAG: gamma carbonic anhydrase family protein [Candidatus Eisenbacteria bacterium]|nr:gamma carbonic anhydrase family protein [Candidatus Eisenbacteria bacterium]MCC7143270.1 gamma carbonic anhydrase family protein [Candidatus Eisenbacteria bacterium]
MALHVSPDARVIPFRGTRPVLGDGVFIAPGVTVIGDVIVAEKSSLWYGTVVRGDVHFIRIGRETNIQDNCVVHVTADTHSVSIGDRVTVGHGAIIHGATLEDGCLIGMGAQILDGARVGEGSLIGAGSLVAPGDRIPPGVLALGSPAKVRRPLNAEERERVRKAADQYMEYALQHARELGLLAR